ncbi:MAG TPA: hypothetical protein VGA85_04570 [Dehalococcoidales bacterium]
MVSQEYSNKGNVLITLGLSLLAFLLAMPISFSSCSGRSIVDDAIVQIWNQETFVATGVIVGDGSQVLTVIDYEFSTPDNYDVVVLGQGKYRASFAAIDARTNATLLTIEGAKFSTAAIGNTSLMETGQQGFIWEWSRSWESSEKTKDNGTQEISGV